MTVTQRWSNGEVLRLRRHLAAARERHPECRAVAIVADEFSASSAQIREVIARADRIAQTETAVYASDSIERDIYGRQRGAIIERLETGLHPHAQWHDPREANAGTHYRADQTPLAQTLAGACVWLRRNPAGRSDVSAELLWCFVVQERCAHEAALVRYALIAAWIDMHAQVAVSTRTAAGLACIERAAEMLVAQCITGRVAQRKPPVQWKRWCVLQESGQRMLWGLADTASRRVAAALR